MFGESAHGKFAYCRPRTIGFLARCRLIDMNSAVLDHRNAPPIGFAENRWRFSSKSTANAFTSIPAEHLRNCRRTSPAAADGSRDPGMALPDSEGTIACRVGTFAAALRSAESSGQFFRPLNLGFQFGPLTDFRGCNATARERVAAV